MKRRVINVQDLRLGKIFHLSCLTCSLCNDKFYSDDPPVLTDDGKIFIFPII